MPTPRSFDDPVQHLGEPRGLDPVQTGGRLVEQQQVERAGQAARELDQASLAGREGTGGAVREVARARTGRSTSAVIASISCRVARDAARWVSGLLPARLASAPIATFSRDRHRVEQLHLLERPAESAPGPGGGADPSGVVPVEERPCRWWAGSGRSRR